MLILLYHCITDVFRHLVYFSFFLYQNVCMNVSENPSVITEDCLCKHQANHNGRQHLVGSKPALNKTHTVLSISTAYLCRDVTAQRRRKIPTTGLIN